MAVLDKKKNGENYQDSQNADSEQQIVLKQGTLLTQTWLFTMYDIQMIINIININGNYQTAQQILLHVTNEVSAMKAKSLIICSLV